MRTNQPFYPFLTVTFLFAGREGFGKESVELVKSHQPLKRDWD